MKAMKVLNTMTKEQVTELVKNEGISKSQKIRTLFEAGLEIKEISTLLGVRYNFAYNVLQNHCIMNDIAVEKTQRDSKRDEIVALLKQGKSLAEVSRMTKTNYNYIWKISKELKLEEAKKSEAKKVETKKDTKVVTKKEEKIAQ